MSRLVILYVCMCKPNKTFLAFAYSHEKRAYVSHIGVFLCCGVSFKSQPIWPFWAAVTVWIWFVKFRYLLLGLCQVCWLLFFGRSPWVRSRVISVLLTAGIGKLLLERHLGHKAHRRRGSEQQRGRNKDVWRLQSTAHNCWLNEITSVQDECSGRWARTGRSLWGGWSPPVPLPLLGVMQVVFWGLDKSHIRLLMGLR